MGVCVRVIMGEDGSGGMMDSQFMQMLSGGGGFFGFGGGGTATIPHHRKWWMGGLAGAGWWSWCAKSVVASNCTHVSLWMVWRSFVRLFILPCLGATLRSVPTMAI